MGKWGVNGDICNSVNNKKKIKKIKPQKTPSDSYIDAGVLEVQYLVIMAISEVNLLKLPWNQNLEEPLEKTHCLKEFVTCMGAVRQILYRECVHCIKSGPLETEVVNGNPAL